MNPRALGAGGQISDRRWQGQGTPRFGTPGCSGVATRSYTYGYGRAEDLAGIFVVVLIAASAFYAGYETIRRFQDPGELRHLGVLAVAGVVGFLGDEIAAQYRIRAGHRIASAALVADGVHARTDGVISLAVVLSAAGAWAGFPLADPVIGLLITVAILFVLRDAAREVYRLRWLGHSLLAQARVTVDSTSSLVEAHRLSHQVEHALLHAVRRLAAATIHTEPLADDAAPAHDLVAHHH